MTSQKKKCRGEPNHPESVPWLVEQIGGPCPWLKSKRGPSTS